jgi:hypothetical protein
LDWVRVIATALDVGVCFPQLPELATFAKALPDLTIILNHLGGLTRVGPYANKDGHMVEIKGPWRAIIPPLLPCRAATPVAQTSTSSWAGSECLGWASTGIPGLGRSVPKSADWREAWALFPGSVAYIWHAGTKAGIVQDSLGSPVCLSLATFGPRLIESCGLIS